MRLAAATLALVLAGAPFAMAPSRGMAIVAAAAALLSLLGALFRARPLVVGGVALAWIEYAIVLWGSAGIDVVGAVVTGTLSFLLLQTVDFAGRFAAVRVPRPAIVSQVGWWLMFCAAVSGLVVAASAVGLGLARPMAPPVAVAIAVAAAGATVASVARLIR